mmetsp:Transcript_7227/g.10754  ORF Transcript_7227/g.10754 Transcript_7227/m.10754 type:complete len:134 (+) Transcript_7227:84-485(+)
MSNTILTDDATVTDPDWEIFEDVDSSDEPRQELDQTVMSQSYIDIGIPASNETQNILTPVFEEPEIERTLGSTNSEDKKHEALELEPADATPTTDTPVIQHEHWWQKSSVGIAVLVGAVSVVAFAIAKSSHHK